MFADPFFWFFVSLGVAVGYFLTDNILATKKKNEHTKPSKSKKR